MSDGPPYHDHEECKEQSKVTLIIILEPFRLARRLRRNLYYRSYYLKKIRHLISLRSALPYSIAI